MTQLEILREVARLAGSYSKASFRRDAARLGIKPIETQIPVNPRQYRPDTARVILAARGYDLRAYFRSLNRERSVSAPLDTAATALENIRRTASALPSPAELRKARNAAKGKARK